MKLIGLGHYSRTGKDTLANYCIEALAAKSPGYRAKKIPLAWKLKDICHQLYAWDGLREPEFYDTPEGEPYRDIVLPTIGKTPVTVWVDMGTPAVRDEVYDKTWIDYLFKGVTETDALFVPDMRFPNEVEAGHEQFGDDFLHGKVVRPGKGPRDTVADRALLGYTGFHFVAGGSGSLDELRWWADWISDWVLGKRQKPWQSEVDRNRALSVEVL
jgi:hypothetical protein